MRELAKKIGVLKTKIDPDGRIRTSYNIGGTNTGRFSSSFSEFGTGCVRPSAETLTPEGWRRIDTIKDGDLIAQWNYGSISFVPCTIHQEAFDGELLEFRTEQACLAITPEHRVIHYEYYKREYQTLPAIEVASKPQVYIPLGGNIDGSLIYPPWLPMLMADFSKESYGWRGGFKKQRKIDRFLEIASIYNIKYDEQAAPEGYRRFAVRGYNDLPKKWGPWVLSLTKICAEELVEEARHWDSHDRGSGFIFFTSSQEQAEWFATLAHLAGRAATIRGPIEQHVNSYSITPMWWVNVKNRGYAQVMRKHWDLIPYTGKVYCPQVPSSYWLVRENGYISVTGNTNLQNIEESLRSIFCADLGMKLGYFDGEQIQSRICGAIWWNLFHDGAYLDACESGDLHTSVAKLVWPRLAWVGDLQADKVLAEQPYYRHYSRRFMCKKIGHGTNFDGKAAEIARQTRIDIDTIRDFQLSYDHAFPARIAWRDWTERQLRAAGYIIALDGRKRWFLGRRGESSQVKEALAFDAQSTEAWIVNTGMLKIFRARCGQLYMHDHDALTIQYPEEQEDEIIPQILEHLRTPIQLKHGRELVVPFGCKVGWNKGEWTEQNPDGLKTYSPGDQRKRSPEVSFLDRVVR
jgi:hypothetical protein